MGRFVVLKKDFLKSENCVTSGELEVVQSSVKYVLQNEISMMFMLQRKSFTT